MLEVINHLHCRSFFSMKYACTGEYVDAAPIRSEVNEWSQSSMKNARLFISKIFISGLKAFVEETMTVISNRMGALL